tara:strand:+ start:4187 stop:5452 length:1266 start_codon:yes stop_codon:yes gene_type:complete
MKFSPKSIRRHKKEDPYSYLVDNLPIAGLLEACVNLQEQIQSAPDPDDYTTSTLVADSAVGYLDKSTFENRTLGQIQDVNISLPVPSNVLSSEDGSTYTNVNHKDSQLHEFLETVSDLLPQNVSGHYLNFNSAGDLSSVPVTTQVSLKDFVDSRYDDEGPDAIIPPWSNNGNIWHAPLGWWFNGIFFPEDPMYNQYYVAFNNNLGDNTVGAEKPGKYFFPKLIGSHATTGPYQHDQFTDAQWLDRLQAIGNMAYDPSLVVGGQAVSQYMLTEDNVVNFGGTGFGSTPAVTTAQWAASASMFEPPLVRNINPVDSAATSKIGGEYIFPDGFIIKWESTGRHSWNDFGGMAATHYWGGTHMTEIYTAIICPRQQSTSVNADKLITLRFFNTDYMQWGARTMGSNVDTNISAKVMCLGRVAKTW